MTTPAIETMPVRPDVLLDTLQRTWNCSGLDAPLLTAALKHLSDAVHAPRGIFPLRWCAAEPGQDLVDNNLFLPLILAWLRLDPSVATDHAKSVLTGQLGDGGIPSTLTPDGIPSDRIAWPLIAQAVYAVWSRTRDPELLDFALPRLQKYLERALDYFDPTGMAKPTWQSVEEAFLPEAFEPGLVSVDLTVFLVCDLAAFLRLTKEHPAYRESTDILSDDYTRLTEQLQDYVWDHRTRRYADRPADGGFSQRIAISSLLPLLHDLLPMDRKNDLRELLTHPRKFGSSAGVPAWVPREKEPPPPVVGVHQILILEALRRSDLPAEARDLRRTLATRLKTAPAPAPSTASAALTVLLPGTPDDPDVQALRIPSLLKAADRYRVLLIGMAVAVLFAGLAVIGFHYSRKPTLTRQSVETMAGLAQQYYKQGDYDNVIRLCESLMASTRTGESLHFMMGNAYYHRKDFIRAEAAYRRALEMKTPPPAAWLNLGLTLYRQDRLEEAAEAYSEFITRYGKFQPNLAAKAQTALELIRAP